MYRIEWEGETLARLKTKLSPFESVCVEIE